MLINIKKPLLVLPEKILLLDQEQKKINLKSIIENTIKHTADISSKKEREIYQRVLKLCKEENSNKEEIQEEKIGGEESQEDGYLIDLSHEEISLLEKWIYESPLKGFLKNSIIALLNGEY